MIAGYAMHVFADDNFVMYHARVLMELLLVLCC